MPRRSSQRTTTSIMCGCRSGRPTAKGKEARQEDLTCKVVCVIEGASSGVRQQWFSLKETYNKAITIIMTCPRLLGCRPGASKDESPVLAAVSSVIVGATAYAVQDACS